MGVVQMRNRVNVMLSRAKIGARRLGGGGHGGAVNPCDPCETVRANITR